MVTEIKQTLRNIGLTQGEVDVYLALLELGFDWRLGKAIFLMGRITGMSAHILEELDQKNSYHRLEETDIVEE